MQLEDILSDHAYCEQKAASSCISIIQQFPDFEEILEKLSPIVSEEWGHFRLVLAELDKRNLKLGFQRKDQYVASLIQFQKKGGGREQRLTEKLLVCALIEARSCERFRLLSEELKDEDLRKFYRKFMISEASHYKLFIELARKYGGRENTDRRWQEYLEFEKGVIKDLVPRGDRMH